MKKVVIFMLFVIAGCYGKVFAQQPAIVSSDKAGWHKIGETTVSFTKEKDEVAVIGADKFSSLKFKVTDAPLELVSAEVYYENGDKQDVKIGSMVKTMGESKVIDLSGGEKALKKVVFVYKTAANASDKKAHVEIWGMKTNADK